MSLRLIDEPLGADADETPTLEAVTAMWETARRQPIPDYEHETLRQFLLRQYREPRLHGPL